MTVSVMTVMKVVLYTILQEQDEEEVEKLTSRESPPSWRVVSNKGAQLRVKQAVSRQSIES